MFNHVGVNTRGAFRHRFLLIQSHNNQLISRQDKAFIGVILAFGKLLIL
jgi:hypothetical protein